MKKAEEEMDSFSITFTRLNCIRKGGVDLAILLISDKLVIIPPRAPFT